jgi:hypothetical protein
MGGRMTLADFRCVVDEIKWWCTINEGAPDPLKPGA